METIFICVKFKPFGEEVFVCASKTKKGIMKKLREEFPYIRGTIENNNLSSDKDNTFLFRVFSTELI